jgi:ABC-type Zn2+ transport system substrate-binding protein/surface adhesin
MSIDANYIADCQAGQVYEQFITKEHDRDTVKVELYKAIYFDFKQKKLISNDFMKLYPLTYKSLQILDEDIITLASKLQNIEASIFNQLKPVKSKYYFTLFDAIYYSDSRDIACLTKQIMELFSRYELVPKI